MGCRSVIGVLAAMGAAMGAPVDFDREIRPIFSDRCFACHGPDEKHRMANLRLDMKDGGVYRVITRGNAATSRIYHRVAPARAPDSEPRVSRMPPVTAGPPLTNEQVQLIKRWIDEGAKWEMHWSYAAPQRVPPPEVKNRKWPRNTIDNF